MLVLQRIITLVLVRRCIAFDFSTGRKVFDSLKTLRDIFRTVPKKWQKKIIEGLKSVNEPELLEIITEGHR